MKWQCINTGDTKGVTNGVHPKNGPTQTVPLDYEAIVESGLYDPEAKPSQKEAQLAVLKELKASGKLPSNTDISQVEAEVSPKEEEIVE